LGQDDDAPPGIPGVLIPEDVAATLGRTGVMPAVVLNRDLFFFVGKVRVLDPTAGLIEHREVDCGFGQDMPNQEQSEFGLFGGVRVGAYQGPGLHSPPVARPALLPGEERVQLMDRGQWISPPQQEVPGDHQVIEA
jgi:hypothetical protein